LASHGAEAVGVDPTEGMLQAARGVPGKATDYRRMSATALALPDALFDVVTCITVIQHLEPREQDVAIAELSRVLRPGGTAVLLDLIDLGDRGKIVYPRAARDWISAYAANGLTVVHWEGQEWIPLIRGFRWIAERVGRLLGLGSDQREGPSLLEETRGRGVFRLAYAGLWVLVQLSKPLEPVCRIQHEFNKRILESENRKGGGEPHGSLARQLGGPTGRGSGLPDRDKDGHNAVSTAS
jgi:SAM-dependent methyltransferase